MAKKYLTIGEEAERIGCSVRSIERAVAGGGYPFIRFGKLRRFDPDLSDAHLAKSACFGSQQDSKAA